MQCAICPYVTLLYYLLALSLCLLALLLFIRFMQRWYAEFARANYLLKLLGSFHEVLAELYLLNPVPTYVFPVDEQTILVPKGTYYGRVDRQ